LKQLRVVVDQVTRGLTAAGLRSRVLAGSELRRQIYGLLNPTHARIVPEPPAWSDDQTAREQLVFSGVLEQRDSLVCDGQLMRVLTLKALPTFTEPALLEALLVGLPFHCRVQVAIEASDSIRALDDLKRRRDQAHLLATLREKRNQEAEAQEQDVAELIDQNLRSSLRMVRVSVSIVLSVDARRPDAALVLDGQTHEVKRVVAGLGGAQIMVDEYAQMDELLATLPGNAKRGRRWRRCTSENAAHLVLAWQPWTGAPAPTLLVQNGRGHLVGLDPFDEALDNPNAFMAGASGSGKSATTNYLLLNLLATGAKALVVDVGGSYRRLMEIFGGRYFAITLDSSVTPALNPFFAPVDILGPGGRLEERRLAFILAVVERMACDARRPELGNAERALLAAAVDATFRACVL
jgi:type IV secretory pathway VirB4 component